MLAQANGNQQRCITKLVTKLKRHVRRHDFLRLLLGINNTGLYINASRRGAIARPMM
jgi:hypothetical protein